MAKGPSEGGKGITEKLKRLVDNAPTILTTPMWQLRQTVAKVLEDSSPNLTNSMSPPDDHSDSAVLSIVSPNTIGVNLAEGRRRELSRTPQMVANLLTITGEDGQPRTLRSSDDSTVISAAFQEVFQRMAEMVFDPKTHPVFSFAHEVFQSIRIRPSLIDDKKVFDEIFQDQVEWFFREEVSRNKQLFSPALVHHWHNYYATEHFHALEENLRGHSISELKLYAILLRSFFRVLHKYFTDHFPNTAEPAEAKETDIKDMHFHRGETPAFRQYARQRAAEQRGELVLPYGLSSFFPVDDTDTVREMFDELLPQGIDGLYLYDTDLFVSAEVEKTHYLEQKPQLGQVINALNLDGAMADRFGMKGFFVVPERNADLSLKDLALWKTIRSSLQPVPSADCAEYDEVSMNPEDIAYVEGRLVQVLGEHSSIEGVLYALFPDIDQDSLYTQAFYKQRFRELACVSRNVLVKGFFGILSDQNPEIWNTPTNVRGEQHLPFEYLQSLASSRAVDTEFMETYESRWNYMRQPTDKAWDPEYPRYFGRVSRLSGWRKKQLQVRSKLILEQFERMHWNVPRHARKVHTPEWWETIEELRVTSEDRVRLSFPFFIGGSAVVCHFRHLQR